jgi:CRP-like cAMP-binding protein
VNDPAMATNVVDALARVPMLSTLDRKHLEKLARDFSERTYEPGAIVVRQGDDRGIGFFVIGDGTATVSVDGKDVSHLGPGDQFGAVAMIAPARVRTATVTADTQLQTWVMTVWDFRSFVRSDPDVAWALLEQLAAMVERSAPDQH